MWSPEEKKEMVLLVKCEGNWSHYTYPKYGTYTYALTNDGTSAGDSCFGSASYFRRWLKNEIEKNPAIEKGITAEGYKFLNDTTIK